MIGFSGFKSAIGVSAVEALSPLTTFPQLYASALQLGLSALQLSSQQQPLDTQADSPNAGFSAVRKHCI